MYNLCNPVLSLHYFYFENLIKWKRQHFSPPVLPCSPRPKQEGNLNIHRGRALILSYIPHASSTAMLHPEKEGQRLPGPGKFPPEQSCYLYQVGRQWAESSASRGLYMAPERWATLVVTQANSRIKQKCLLPSVQKFWLDSLWSSDRPSMFHWLKTFFFKKRLWNFQFLVQPIRSLEIATHPNNRKKLSKLNNGQLFLDLKRS